jgi:hypothetical protein
MNDMSGANYRPEEIDDLPPEYVQVFLALRNELPKIRKGIAAQQKAFQDARDKHPTYRK